MSNQQWQEADAVAFRDFIKKTPHFIDAIKARLEPITATESIEARAMSGSERRGADNVILIIQGLAEPDVKTEQSPFIP